MHMYARSKQLIIKIYELGISFSYDRILQVENEVPTGICEKMKKKSVVCSVELFQGLFTIGVLNNLDLNHENTTAKGFFHGKDISLFQSLTATNRGQIQEGITLMS